MSNLTLDEAIKHCQEVAEKLDEKAKTLTFPHLPTEMKECRECAANHRQLAEWLTDYKELKNSIGAVKLSNMKEALKLIRAYKAENIAQKKLIAEYKRLLKAAVEDFHNVLTSQIKITNYTLCEKCKYYLYCNCKDKCLARYDLKQWRYADETLALIGEDGDTK